MRRARTYMTTPGVFVWELTTNKKILQKKINYTYSSPAMSLKFGEYYSLPIMVKLLFISYAKPIPQ